MLENGIGVGPQLLGIFALLAELLVVTHLAVTPQPHPQHAEHGHCEEFLRRASESSFSPGELPDMLLFLSCTEHLKLCNFISEGLEACIW